MEKVKFKIISRRQADSCVHHSGVACIYEVGVHFSSRSGIKLEDLESNTDRYEFKSGNLFCFVEVRNDQLPVGSSINLKTIVFINCSVKSGSDIYVIESKYVYDNQDCIENTPHYIFDENEFFNQVKDFVCLNIDKEI